MTTLDTTRTTYGSATGTSRILSPLHALASALVAWNDARVTRKALSSLTDRELEDIGLSRADIDAVADGHLIR